MDASVVFLDCPAYMDKTGSVRCGLPAEVQGRYLMTSTDGPLESAKIRCPTRPLVQRPGRVADVRGAPGRRGRARGHRPAQGRYRPASGSLSLAGAAAASVMRARTRRCGTPWP